MRVPDTGRAERERLSRIEYIEKKLVYFQRIPSHRREDECADEGEATCRAMLVELGAPGKQATPSSAVELQTLDQLLDEIERQ